MTQTKRPIILSDEALRTWFGCYATREYVPQEVIEDARSRVGDDAKVIGTRAWESLYADLGDTYFGMPIGAFKQVVTDLGFVPAIQGNENRLAFLAVHKEKGLVLWAKFISFSGDVRLYASRVYGEIRYTGVYRTQMKETTRLDDLVPTFREEPVLTGQYADAWDLIDDSLEIGFYDHVHLLNGCPFAIDATKGLANHLARFDSCKVAFNEVWQKPLKLNSRDNHLFDIEELSEHLQDASPLEILRWVVEGESETIRDIMSETRRRLLLTT